MLKGCHCFTTEEKSQSKRNCSQSGRHFNSMNVNLTFCLSKIWGETLDLLNSYYFAAHHNKRKVSSVKVVNKNIQMLSFVPLYFLCVIIYFFPQHKWL